MKISELFRPNIKNLTPYSSARDEFQGADAVFIDANENPYGRFNRYPDPHQTQLKTKLSEINNFPTSQIFIGNGSDEIIDLSLRIFCEPGKDQILICPPTYGMYEVAAAINNIKVLKVPLITEFQLDTKTILKKAEKESIKMIFLCSPNNPTGNSLENIEEIIREFKGIVFVDEAYIEFSEKDSFIDKINTYPNLIISQTFSKARALAGARVGVAFSSPEIIEVFNRVKPPYNVSALNQNEALACLKDAEVFETRLQRIKSERSRMQNALQELTMIKRVYPTEASFILFEVDEVHKVYAFLVKNNVIIRNRNQAVKNTLRASVGTPEENKKLIEILKDYEKAIAH